MVVYDEESMEEALLILAASPEGVRYSDEFLSISVTKPETLEHQCQRALARNSVAIVYLPGHEVENHAVVLRRVRAQRAEEEKRKIREWVREHPEQVKKYMKRL